MQISQITPFLKYGDITGNTVLNLQEVIRGMGIKSDIYAAAAEEVFRGRVQELACLDDEKNSTVIYHMFTDSEATRVVAGLKTPRKIMFYYYISPPDYFSDYHAVMHHKRGREELTFLKDHIALSITNSKYSERSLNEIGYERTLVLPPLINLREYTQEPNPCFWEMYRDDHVNILFAGRLSPADKLEDIIGVFNYYHKRINPKSRLFLVGDYLGHMGYYRKLLALIYELQIKNVFITGRVSHGQLLAYYKLADVFISLSESDGCCTPIIVSMHFQIPVIAYNSGAVPEVLGEAGRLVDDKDIRETARLVDLLVSDKKIRKETLNRQSERIADYHPDKVFLLYKKAIEKIIHS